MATSASARATSIYNAAKTYNANFGKLSSAEQTAFLNALTYIFGSDGAGNGDLTYLLANVDVLPTALSGTNLNNPTGQPVVIPSTGEPGSPSAGSTSVLSIISGKGSIQ